MSYTIRIRQLAADIVLAVCDDSRLAHIVQLVESEVREGHGDDGGA